MDDFPTGKEGAHEARANADSAPYASQRLIWGDIDPSAKLFEGTFLPYRRTTRVSPYTRFIPDSSFRMNDRHGSA